MRWIIIPILVLVAVRGATTLRRQFYENASASRYPAGTFLTDVSSRLNYRFINLYTLDPDLARGPEWRIDRFGFRLDENNLSLDAHGDFKMIWMLGGSTTLGLGVRENDTIAAHLNRRLAREGRQWRVLNLGQGGFTSQQELLLFLELVERGFRPDAVLVYDGINEITYAGATRDRGTPQWEINSPKTQLVRSMQAHRESRAMLSLVGDLFLRLSDWVTPYPARYPGENWNEIMGNYRRRLSLIESVAQSVGARASFYFQPVLGYELHFGLRTPSEEERRIAVPEVRENEYRRLEAFHSDHLLAQRDLTAVFRGHDGETLYVDARHPNARGNEIIADALYGELP